MNLFQLSHTMALLLLCKLSAIHLATRIVAVNSPDFTLTLCHVLFVTLHQSSLLCIMILMHEEIFAFALQRKWQQIIQQLLT
jgi:hypothetical protein